MQENVNVEAMVLLPKDLGYTKQSTILLSTYRKQWGKFDVLRELLSNAFDATKVWVTLKGDSTKTIVSDEGNGLTLGQLIYLGCNEGKTADSIGQFGEGLKVSITVTERLGLKVSIRAKTYEVKVGSEEPLFKIEDNAKAIVFYIKEGLEEVKGTTITIEGLPLDEANEIIKGKFLINPEASIIHKANTSILSDEYKGKLFVKGVYVQDLVNANFGYDIKTLKLNTDRQAVSINEILKLIAYDIDTIHNKALAESYVKKLLENTECLERQALDTTIYTSTEVLEAFNTLLGDHHVLSADESLRGEIRHRGRDVLVLNKAWINHLEQKGFKKTANKYLADCEEELMKAKRKTIYDISESKRNVLIDAIEALKNAELFTRSEMLNFDITIKIFSGEDFKKERALGFYDPKDGTVNVNEKVLNDIADTCKVLVHEYSHKTTGFSDATAEFQAVLDTKISKLFEFMLKNAKSLALFEAKPFISGDNLIVSIPPKFKERVGQGYVKVKITKYIEDQNV